MDPSKLLDLFEELIELSPQDRERRLRTLRKEDESTARDLEQMLVLDASEEETDALSRLVAEEADAFRGSGDSALPSQVGDYEILGPLGRGSFGVVLHARRTGSQREVALKLLKFPLEGSVATARFEREARILGLLDHPSIAKVYETGRATLGGLKQPFIAMELVKGTSLTQHVKDRALDLGERLRLFVEVCRAIDHANQAGVVHRDLKPANILVPNEGSPKVVDFGIARVDDQSATLLTQSGEALGTPSYMSPEQVRGDRGLIDPRTDVYSLGAILYELLVDDVPLHTGNCEINVAFDHVLHEVPERPSRRRTTLPAAADWICLKALEKDPAHRYSSAGLLAEDVERLLEDRAPLASSPPLYRRISRWSRNRPVLATSIASLVAFALGLAGYLAVINLGGAFDLKRAWDQGDLASVVARSSSTAPWLAELILEDYPRVVRAGERGGDVPNALADVLELIVAEGAHSAAWRAAAYLERDGIKEHPALARFLEHRLQLALDSKPSRPGAVAQVARLFSDRQAHDLADLELSSPIRQSLHALPWSDLKLETRLDVLVALGGCGDGSSLDALLERLEAIYPPATSGDWEVFRVGFASAELIFRRHQRLALDVPDEMNAIAWQDLAARMIKFSQDYRWRTTRESSDMLLAIAFLRRAQGLPALEDLALLRRNQTGIRIQGVHGNLDAIESDLERLSHDFPARHLDRVRRLECLAFTIGALEKAEEGSRLLTELRAIAARGSLDARSIERHIQIGLDDYAQRSEGIRLAVAPDADTHLGYALGREATPLEADVVRTEPESLEVGGCWDFSRQTWTVSGVAQAVRHSDVQRIEDEIYVDEWYAKLSPIASSRMLLPLEGFQPPPHSKVAVEIHTANGKRRFLPNFGRASLVVELDGREIGRVAVAHADAAQPIAIPLGVEEFDGAARTLELSLTEDSTTTVRVRAVVLATR